MRRVFISHHHDNDQNYKEALLDLNARHDIFVDWSVEVGDIDDSLDHQTIRRIIRDDYLRDSTVTLLLCGTETWGRKHIDWELKSSMIDGKLNKRSGIIVVNLPTTGSHYFTATHEGEKAFLYPECQSWVTIDERKGYEERYPHMPARITDNLLRKDGYISVTPWTTIVSDPEKLRFLVEAAAEDRLKCEYDLSRPMRMRDA